MRLFKKIMFVLFLSLTFSALVFSQQQEKEPPRSIRVNGVGKVRVVPDQLHISLKVNVPRAETAVEALSQNSQFAAQVIRMLRRFDIAETDIQTTRVSVNPVYDYSKKTSPPTIVGYSAQNEVHVAVKKMDDAGKILDQAVKNGATGFGPIQYESSKRTDLEREALARAADDARVKATLLAKQLGAMLGRVMTISESGVSYPSPMMQMRMESKAAGADVPVMPGEMEISASVEVVFELK
ncbi:MAG TPA: SIMPL domain-containing protein [Bacteroidota bacterium]